MSDIGLSIIIPAYNEEKRLSRSLKDLVEKVSVSFSPFEIIIVDDGSGDGTAEVAADFSRTCSVSGVTCRLVKIPGNRGKGHAVKAGMLEASGDLALMTDADLSTPVEELTGFARILEQHGADIVIGSRGLADSDVRVHQPWYREYGGKVFNLVVRGITWLPFRDTQCGFKLFRMSSCRPIFEKLRIDGFAFDVEILFIAGRKGLKVIEEPVTWNHSEGSKVRMLPDSIATFFQLFHVRWNSLMGRYK